MYDYEDSIIDYKQSNRPKRREYIDDYLNTIILSENKDEYIQKYKRLYDKLFKQINIILLNNAELKKLNQISIIK